MPPISETRPARAVHGRDETRGIVIVGGGAIGLSLACHLARRGAEDVLLLERHQLTAGTTWHAAGIVGPLRATANMTRIAMEAGRLIPRLEAETGVATGYRRTGGYWLARVPERMDELHRIAALGRHLGLSPEMVTAEALARAVPAVAVGGLCGVMAVAEDASVDPVGLAMAYAKAARAGGVEIREGAGVARLIAEGGRIAGVELADGGVIRAGRVGLCAGAWSKRLAAGVGLHLPVQPVEHMYVVTEPRPAFDGFPVLRDLDRGIYVKGDAGKLVIGGFERDAKCWDPEGPEGDRAFLELAEDWEQIAPFMEGALDLIPELAETGIRRFMNGPESFTADTRPLIGEAPEVDGLFVAAGMNSVGVMSSAGVGRVLADWMAEGRAPMDLWEVDLARADPRAAGDAHMAARMREAVADQFALHWPFKQPVAGRGLRRSALHESWAAAGAVFGVTGGWERGLWYAGSAAERDLPDTVGAQPWWPIAAREAAAMAEGTVLIDLSPFTKIRVSGAGARAALDRLTSARLPGAAGRAVYAPFLNGAGGIEIEAVVTYVAEGVFEVTSAAATRWRDGAWLRRHLEGAGIEDRTEDFCVIGVMGAGSRETLRRLAPDWREVGYGHAAEATVAGVPVRATRLSFVGELGWELTVAADLAGALFAALIAGGARPMGHRAVEGCRLEKGFLHWGHDIGPEVTPLEAGIGFAVDWSKDFLGRGVLEGQRGGLTRRLRLLALEGDPLVLHDEPVREGGRVVGLTTSGGRGPRTGLTLGFAMLEETGAAPGDRRLEVEIAGARHPARVLMRPPFDPAGERMRA